MTVIKGSVRVDLLGGTIDLNPINLILKNVVTLNAATSLQAEVHIKDLDQDIIRITSIDYDSTNDFALSAFQADGGNIELFGPLNFMAQIIAYFKPQKGLEISLSSGSPPGAGLGGSSSMGVTLFKALSHHYMRPFDPFQAIKIVNALEGRILDKGPAGYQDYYPAVFGGILGLKASPDGVEVLQLHNESMARFLESHLTLVFSGENRLSGINNWEVYKSFFDQKNGVREGLEKIADYSFKALKSYQEEDGHEFIRLLCCEGDARKDLFPNILTPKMNDLINSLKEQKLILGQKVCGAGGGGCFLLAHHPQDAPMVGKQVQAAGMHLLDWRIMPPIL